MQFVILFAAAGLTSPPYKYNFSVKKDGDAAGGEEQPDAGSGPEGEVRDSAVGEDGKVRSQQRRQRRQPRDRPVSTASDCSCCTCV